MEATITEEQTKRSPEPIKDELDLAEYPVTLVSRRVPKGVKTIEYTDWITVDGQRVPLKWTVTGADAWGLPTGGDQDMLMCILSAASEAGFKDSNISVASTWGLLKKLYPRPNGENYRRFKHSLLTLKGVTIVAEHALRDKKSGQLIRTRAFGLIDDFDLIERYRPGQHRAPAILFGHIRLSGFLFERCRDGWVKSLDFALYKALPTPMSRRLYRYLDKQRRYAHHFTIGVAKLSAKLGLAQTAIAKYRPAKLRQLLTPALDALRAEHYLERHAFRQGKDGLLVTVWFAGGEYNSKRNGNAYNLTDDEAARTKGLAMQIADVCGQEQKNAGYYFKVAAEAVRGRYVESLFQALGATKEAKQLGEIKTTASQYFTDQLERRKPQLDLPLPTPKEPPDGAARGV